MVWPADCHCFAGQAIDIKVLKFRTYLDEPFPHQNISLVWHQLNSFVGLRPADFLEFLHTPS